MQKYTPGALNKYSVVNCEDQDFKTVQDILENGTNDEKLDKALGAFYGMVIGIQFYSNSFD